MKTLLTLLMLTLFVSCGDNTTDTGDKGITVDPGTESYSYSPVDVYYGEISYLEFTEAVKQGKFINYNYRNYEVTLNNYHWETTSGTFLFFQTTSSVQVNDGSFTREINDGELNYKFDSNSGVTSDYMDVVIMLNEIVESKSYAERVAPAAFRIYTTSGISYIVDLNRPVIQNPAEMYDTQNGEGFYLSRW